MRRLFPLLLLLLPASAAGQQHTDSLLTLPFRIHLMQSEIRAVRTTGYGPFMERFLNDTTTYGKQHGRLNVNTIWRQAGIVWKIESIVTTPAHHAEQYDRLVQTRSVLPDSVSKVVATVIEDGELLSPGWNIFLLYDFGRHADGVFLREYGAVVYALMRTLSINPVHTVRIQAPAMLAHELGHALGLPHVRNGTNLMRPGTLVDFLESEPGLQVPAPHTIDNLRLTQEQIAAARRQARTGRPAISP